jgi:putative flippase GtrA
MVEWRERFWSLMTRPFIRFFAASLFGLVFDISLAASLNRYAEVHLMVAAAVSLIAASALMYLVHEFWTFQSGKRRFSLARMSGTIASALIAICVRTSCIYITSTILALRENWGLIQLVFATGVSFIVNYLIVRRIVGGKLDCLNVTAAKLK